MLLSPAVSRRSFLEVTDDAQQIFGIEVTVFVPRGKELFPTRLQNRPVISKFCGLLKRGLGLSARGAASKELRRSRGGALKL